MDEVRKAATMLVVRPANDRGVEVLVGRRHPRSRFAPGFVVFPGGAVEPGDAALAGRLFGDPTEAARACAVRELYEETALLLTAHGLESRPGGEPLDAVAFDPPDAGAIAGSAHWLAPDFLEVRFDAVFFSIPAPRGLEPVPDGVEIERAWWARPADVLASSAEGQAPLMWPTLVTLDELDGAATVEKAVALRVEQVAPPPVGVQPRRGVWQRPEGTRP